MHPGPEIIAIEARKSALRERIARRRHELAADTGRVFRPLAQVDQGFRLWQRVPGIARAAALPLVLSLVQLVVPQVKIIRRLVRWAPVILTGWRAVRGAWQGVRGAEAGN
jgi:hypothetical protein